MEKIVILGKQGVGKTTLAKKIHNWNMYIVEECDDIDELERWLNNLQDVIIISSVFCEEDVDRIAKACPVRIINLTLI